MWDYMTGTNLACFACCSCSTSEEGCGFQIWEAEEKELGVQGGRHQLKCLEIQAVRWARWGMWGPGDCKSHPKVGITQLWSPVCVEESGPRLPHLWIFQEKLEMWIFKYMKL